MRQHAFGFREREARLVLRLRFNEEFEGDIAGIALAGVTRAETFRACAGSHTHRFAQNAAADIRRARITRRELLAGEVPCGPSQVFVIQLPKIAFQQRSLFEFPGGCSHGFGCSGESFE